VSTDKKMQSSIRVMPSCFIMGQAAGLGAALAIKNGAGEIRAIDIRELQEKIRDIGGFLPG